MILALLVLVALTLIGISSIQTTIFESSISGNERARVDAFYAAEAGVQAGLREIKERTESCSISQTKIGEDRYYSVKGEYLGLAHVEGGPSNFEYQRFKINATGEAFGARQEIEVQIKDGPFPSGTGY